MYESFEQFRLHTVNNLLRKIKRFTLITLPALGLLEFSTLSAIAANRYAVFCITNKTDVTVNYSYQWGSDEWRSISLSPRKSRTHSMPYERANQNSSPTPRIRFDSDLRQLRVIRRRGIQRNYFITYSLKKNASPEPSCSYGKQYHFVYDGKSNDFIDLQQIEL